MDKSPDAFRTISEVAELLDTPAHVLRFWESRFPQIKPVKRAGGRRYYRPADMALLAGIRRLLHEDGLTIRGVQKILREQGVRHVSGLSEDEDQLEEIDLNVEDAVTEEVTIARAPIALFPAPRGHDTPAVVAPEDSWVEDEPAPEETAPEETAAQATAPEETQDDLDVIDEAALLAALEGPLEDQSPRQDPSAEGEQGAPQSEAPHISARQVSAVDDQPAEPAHDVPPAAVNDTANAVPSVPVDDLAAKPATTPQDDSPAPEPELTPAPPPIPPSLEISGHWLPADLRALRRGAFAAKQGQVEALLQRLEVLRNRVGDLGRVPRR